jgi:hypothetical protein
MLCAMPLGLHAPGLTITRASRNRLGQTMSEIVAYGTAAVIEPFPCRGSLLLHAGVLVFGGVMLAAAALGARPAAAPP